MQQFKTALTIAGSDSGGGAGIQADLKTFEAHRVFGTSVITALTAQNTVGVQAAEPVSPEMVRAQLESVTSDFQVSAAKTGMLYHAPVMEVIARHIFDHSRFPLVVDPVMVATSGDALLAQEGEQAMQELILPLATVLTPNLHEAEKLAGMPIRTKEDVLSAAAILSERYSQAWVLIKGGHLEGETASDYLTFQDHQEWLETPWIDTRDTHGTGCTLSAAIAAELALGRAVPQAVRNAKSFLTGALRHAWTGLGSGHGSLRHHHLSLSSE